MTTSESLARYKLAAALRLARDTRRDSWARDTPQGQRRVYRELSRDSMDDARYWRGELRAALARQLAEE